MSKLEQFKALRAVLYIATFMHVVFWYFLHNGMKQIFSCRSYFIHSSDKWFDYFVRRSQRLSVVTLLHRAAAIAICEAIFLGEAYLCSLSKRIYLAKLVFMFFVKWSRPPYLSNFGREYYILYSIHWILVRCWLIVISKRVLVFNIDLCSLGACVCQNFLLRLQIHIPIVRVWLHVLLFWSCKITSYA